MKQERYWYGYLRIPYFKYRWICLFIKSDSNNKLFKLLFFRTINKEKKIYNHELSRTQMNNLRNNSKISDYTISRYFGTDFD